MDRARQPGEIRTLITQHSAILAPFGWMAACEVTAWLAHAVRGLDALYFIGACSVLAGAQTYRRLRNRRHGHAFGRLLGMFGGIVLDGVIEMIGWRSVGVVSLAVLVSLVKLFRCAQLIVVASLEEFADTGRGAFVGGMMTLDS